MVHTRLTGIPLESFTRDAPEFVPTVYDTPMRLLRSASPTLMVADNRSFFDFWQDNSNSLPSSGKTQPTALRCVATFGMARRQE